MKLELGAPGQKLKIIINLIVVVAALISMARREIKLEEASFFDAFLINTFAPIQKMVTSSHNFASNLFLDYLANIKASRENRKLKYQISQLEKRIFNFREISKENERLKDLLQFGSNIPYRKVLAQIVAWDSSSDFKVIRVNKGTKDGIKLQSTVVTAEGLVGYVYRLTEHFADILTIMDSNNRIDALIHRIRAHGIVEGLGQGKCQMKYVTRTEPIILNDIVITSGLGNVYPKGIKVGHVSKIEKESYGIVQFLEVTPAVDFSKIEEVVVLVSENNALQKEWNALNDVDMGEGGK